MNAFFLDRDGVINVDNGYVFRKEDFIFKDGLFNSLKWIQSKGYKIFILTNQSGIGRNFFNESDFIELTSWMIEILKNNHITIEEVQYCPHHPNDNCKCRKPMTGMFEAIIQRYPINISKSWVIGDKDTDIQMAERVGLTNTILMSDNIYQNEFNCNPKIKIRSWQEFEKNIEL